MNQDRRLEIWRTGQAEALAAAVKTVLEGDLEQELNCAQSLSLAKDILSSAAVSLTGRIREEIGEPHDDYVPHTRAGRSR